MKKASACVFFCLEKRKKKVRACVCKMNMNAEEYKPKLNLGKELEVRERT